MEYNLERDCVSWEELTTAKFCTEGTLYQKELYYLSKIIKQTKKTKSIQYKPIMWIEIEHIFDEFKFNSLRIILYS